MTRNAQIILSLITLRWLAGIAENLGVPNASESAALALLISLVVTALWRTRIERCTGLLSAGFLGWILTAVASAGANPDAATGPALALIGLLSLYLLLANNAYPLLATHDTQRQLGRFLVAFIMVGSLLAILQSVTNLGFVDPTRPDLTRAIGSDVHPVSFGIQMVAALVAFACLRLKQGGRLGYGIVTLWLMGGIALYLTYARTAWALGGLCFFALIWSRSGQVGKAVMALFFPGLALAAARTDRFEDLKSMPEFLQSFSFGNPVFDYRFVDNSLSWRIVNWAQGWIQAMERPLLGWGPGQSATASNFALEMHNIFLECFFEGGIFGLAFLLVIIAGLVRLHQQLPKATAADRHSRAMVNGFGIGLLLAVTVSTSLVDQLMSFILYLMVLATACQPSTAINRPQPELRECCPHRVSDSERIHPGTLRTLQPAHLPQLLQPAVPSSDPLHRRFRCELAGPRSSPGSGEPCRSASE